MSLLQHRMRSRVVRIDEQIMRFDRKLPASRHGVARVHHQIQQDLLDLPGIPLEGELPADGSAHGFDNNSDALDISHVNMAKYIEGDKSFVPANKLMIIPTKIIEKGNVDAFWAELKARQGKK